MVIRSVQAVGLEEKFFEIELFLQKHMKSYTQSQPKEPLLLCRQNGYGLVEKIIGIVKRLN